MNRLYILLQIVCGKLIENTSSVIGRREHEDDFIEFTIHSQKETKICGTK